MTGETLPNPRCTEEFSVPSFWINGWDKVAPVSKDMWCKIERSLAAHAENVTEDRRQNPKNGMATIRWGMLLGSLVTTRHSITQLWILSNLGYYDTEDHQQQSGDLWDSGLSDSMSLTGLDTDTDMSWQRLGHVFRLILATLNVPKEVSY